jgi:hypothetical protein
MLETFGMAAAFVAALASAGAFSHALPKPQFFAPAFVSAERAVDNWRRESARNLDLAPEQIVSILLGREIRGLSRCVRLNNYWCVKKAGWTGEIAADSEGHVAFAGASDGAGVAAALLRRYYVDFNLHSARAIVQRWAPAQCGPTAVGLRTPARRAAGMGGRTMLSPEPNGLTTHGLGHTLRAKWLASHGRGVATGGKRARVVVRRSVVADRVGPMMKTPTIAAGIGAMEASAPPVRLAMLPFPGVALAPAPGFTPALPPLPTTNCATETQRIANYATHIAEGIAAGPDADLQLFDEQGQPTPAFARALFNMAAVEIGPLKARQDLVEAAVAGMARKQ